jgi:hypothetical protein
MNPKEQATTFSWAPAALRADQHIIVKSTTGKTVGESSE